MNPLLKGTTAIAAQKPFSIPDAVMFCRLNGWRMSRKKICKAMAAGHLPHVTDPLALDAQRKPRIYIQQADLVNWLNNMFVPQGEPIRAYTSRMLAKAPK